MQLRPPVPLQGAHQALRRRAAHVPHVQLAGLAGGGQRVGRQGRPRQAGHRREVLERADGLAVCGSWRGRAMESVVP